MRDTFHGGGPCDGALNGAVMPGPLPGDDRAVLLLGPTDKRPPATWPGRGRRGQPARTMLRRWLLPMPCHGPPRTGFGWRYDGRGRRVAPGAR